MMKAQHPRAVRTRNRIIEVAAGILNTRGYAGTSLSDITDATGLTKGSIYGHFGSKEELALAVFDYNYGKVKKIIQQQIEVAPTGYDQLMVYATVYGLFAGGDFPKGGCPVLNTAVEADDTHPLLKEKAAHAIGKWKKDIEDTLKKGIQAGEFKEGIDQARLALSIIALIEGGLMIAKLTDRQADMNKILATVRTLIEDVKK